MDWVVEVVVANEDEGGEGGEGGRIVDEWEVLMGMELVVLLVVELEVVLWRVCRWEGWGCEAVGWVSMLGEGEEIIAIALF